MTAILEIKNLIKSFGSVEVLKDISLSIDKGEFLVLLGPSGCGKSTLLNCIAGLEEITDGVLKINGKAMNDVPPKDRDIAMVFQSYAL
ncbi:MAG: ATP-binding cassette domain-containing protein, partial [Alphaproteobacteria bacterium]